MPAVPPDPPAAGLLRRLGAMLYDSLLLFGVLFAAGGLYTAVHDRLFHSGGHTLHATGEVVRDIQPAASGPVYSLYLLGVIFLFYAVFWLRSGQTLGMQAWRMRLQTETGERARLGHAAIRFAGAVVSMACAGLGFWWILVDRRHRAWHDIWSKTRIVVEAKPGSLQARRNR